MTISGADPLPDTGRWVAHRGYPARFPENTRPSVEAALAAGAVYLEVDVQVTDAGIPLLCHDTSLERLCGQRRSIFAVTAADLPALEVTVPATFGDRFRGTYLMWLGELASLLEKHIGVFTFIELKSESLQRQGVTRCWQAIEDAMRRLRGRAAPISFDLEALGQLRSWAELPVGAVLTKPSDQQRRAIDSLQPDFLFGDRRYWSPAAFASWQGPWTKAVYTIDRLGEAEPYWRSGVPLVETDNIGAVLDPSSPAAQQQ